METGKIIVMANQKGGVAKTSSTRNLAYSLAELGKKVLAVDFDPQTNLTISFGVAPAALQETTASLMMKLVMDEAMPEKGSYILNIGKVDLLPSKKTLTVAEVNLLIERKDECLAKLLAPSGQIMTTFWWTPARPLALSPSTPLLRRMRSSSHRPELFALVA